MITAFFILCAGLEVFDRDFSKLAFVVAIVYLLNR